MVETAIKEDKQQSITIKNKNKKETRDKDKIVEVKRRSMEPDTKQKW